MPGNSERRGAVRKSSKNRTVGSGGIRRRALEGRGPTPKAEDRQYHPAAKKAAREARAAEAAAGGSTSRSGGGRSSGAPKGVGQVRGPAAARRPARPRRRDEDGPEVLYGRNSVLEALRAGVPMSSLYILNRIESDDRVKESLTLALENGIPVLEAGRAELDRMADGQVHQGMVGQVPPYEYLHPEDLRFQQLPGIPLVVACDGITDPRNLGAIVRATAAFEGHGVLLPARRSVGMTAAAWKTSAGAAARVPVAQATNLTRALEEFREAGWFVVGLDGDGDVSLPELALTDVPLVVVVGAEGKGLSRLVRETCDQVVSIPISRSVESLNAAVATGIALYQVAVARGARGR